jgi:predicted RNase H-like nuclease
VTRVLGVDGCPQGWVAVALADGEFVEARLASYFAELVDDAASVVGVDIPLGSAGSPRAADEAARERLGPRRGSVFAPPPPDVLHEPDHASANAACRARHGHGVSAQAWNLVPKMLDVEPHWRDRPDRIFEVHPELSFAELGGAPRPHAKRTWAGTRDRAALLARAGVTLPDDLGVAGLAGADDVLDAAAVAWSAARLAAGTARHLPTSPERDDAGRLVAIWW